MGRLTTHVLDTAHGRPGADIAVDLLRLADDGTLRVVTARRTNRDGRTDQPLLEGMAMTAGVYELHFAVGAYFRQTAVPVASPPFLDIVPVRFAIADPDAHYHVPLLVSPWSYTTYRGS